MAFRIAFRTFHFACGQNWCFHVRKSKLNVKTSATKKRNHEQKMMMHKINIIRVRWRLKLGISTKINCKHCLHCECIVCSINNLRICVSGLIAHCPSPVARCSLQSRRIGRVFRFMLCQRNIQI